MSVSLPSRRFSLEEKKELVFAYGECEYGSKGEFLEGVGVSVHQIRSWRRAIADGDLDRGLVPRHTGSMNRKEIAEIRRLMAENEALVGQVEQMRLERDLMAQAADALGKAIGVMQMHGVGLGEGE